MTNAFDAGAEQLRRTGDQLNQVTQALRDLMLGQLVALSEVVQSDPTLVDIYASGLARIRAVDEALGSEALQAETALTGPLADVRAANETERAELEAFFVLFAPDDPRYVEYLESRLGPSSFMGPAHPAATEETVPAADATRDVTVPEPELEPELQPLEEISGRSFIHLTSNRLAAFASRLDKSAPKVTLTITGDKSLAINGEDLRYRVPTDGSDSVAMLVTNRLFRVLIEEGATHASIEQLLEPYGDVKGMHGAAIQAINKLVGSGLLIRGREGRIAVYSLTPHVQIADERTIITTSEPAPESKAQPPTETEPEHPKLILKIRGQIADLTPLQRAILESFVRKNDPLTIGGVYNQELVAEVLRAEGIDQKDFGPYTKRAVAALNKLYEGIIADNGETRRGKRYFWNRQQFPVSLEREKVHRPKTPSAPAAPKTDERADAILVSTPQAPAADHPSPEPDTVATSPRTTGEVQPPKTKRLDPQANILWPHAVQRGGKIHSFDDTERVIVGVLSSAARKEPLSIDKIISGARGRGLTLKHNDVKTALQGLLTKIGADWLMQVGGGNDRQKGWRLAAGIRVKQQA